MKHENSGESTSEVELHGARRAGERHHDLDALAGTWTEEDWAEFERALAEQRRIEPDVRD